MLVQKNFGPKSLFEMAEIARNQSKTIPNQPNPNQTKIQKSFWVDIFLGQIFVGATFFLGNIFWGAKFFGGMKFFSHPMDWLDIVNWACRPNYS